MPPALSSLPLALLQIAQDTSAAALSTARDTAAAVASLPPAAPAAPPTFADRFAGGLEQILLGGPVMIPILLLSVLTVVLVFERYRVLRRAQSDPERLIRTVADYVNRGDVAGAAAYCRTENTPASRIVGRGLERLGRPIGEIKEAVQEAGRRETYKLETRMDLLATVASLAPMLGFLGTVTGMISAFRQIQAYEGMVNPSLLAGGISEALITTAAGLIVGVPALFFYNVLLTRIGKVVNSLEHASSDFIDVLQTPAPRASASAPAYVTPAPPPSYPPPPSTGGAPPQL